jgi:hypothetical protein
MLKGTEYTSYTLEQAERCNEFAGDSCKVDSCCQDEKGASEVDLARNCDVKINTKEDLYNFEAWGGQKNCAVTGMKPREPRSLSFCHKFNEKACCAPVVDDENTVMFNMLTGVGLSCRIRGDIREDPLAQWYCMNCDPEQPSYVRAAAHEPLSPDCNADDDGCGSSPGEGRDSTLLICEDWARASFGTDPILEGPNGRFDLCGLLKSSPCLDGDGVTIPDRDPYTCGDDLVIPSSYIVSDSDGNVNEKDSLEAFMNVDSMGPPILNEDFYFKIVPRYDANGQESWCDETVLETAYAALDTTAGEMPQPVCLRTKDQLVTTKYTFGNGASKITFQEYFCNKTAEEDCAALNCDDQTTHRENPCCCAPWEAEACFDSAVNVASSIVAVAASAVAYFMF